ncbi:hypothetical protein MD484_g8691, partial [Candolleomyces efflorescens]
MAGALCIGGIFIIVLALALAPGPALISTAFTFLFHKRQEQNVLVTQMQERQTKYEATLDELRENLSRHEADLLQARAQNRSLAKRNEEYQDSALSTQQSMLDLSQELSKARESVAEHTATIAQLKAADASAVTELWQKVSTLESDLRARDTQNRDLMEENAKHKSCALSMQESIRILSEDLLDARQRAAQYDTANIDLTERNLKLEAKLCDSDDRLAQMSQKCSKAASSAVVLQQALDQKTKEAADWKDLYMHPEAHPPPPYKARQQRSASDTSLTSIIASKNEQIAKLEDRVSECHALLDMCSPSAYVTVIVKNVSGISASR